MYSDLFDCVNVLKTYRYITKYTIHVGGKTDPFGGENGTMPVVEAPKHRQMFLSCLVGTPVHSSEWFPGRAVGRLHRVAPRGGTQGGLNCPTHVLPRCLPTPNTMEADGNGYGAITGRGGPLGRRLE